MVPITIKDKVSFSNKYSLIPTIKHSGNLNRAITGLLTRTDTLLLGTLAITSWFLMLKKILPTIIHHTSFFTAKFKFFSGSTINFDGFVMGFCVILDIVFGCDNATYNPSPVWELSLLTQFAGITTLESLVLKKQYKGA